MVEQGAQVVCISALGESNGDWARLVCHEVLEGTSGHVVIEEGAQVVSIRTLSKCDSDRAGLVCHQVL
jgi:hypothetical protein